MLQAEALQILKLGHNVFLTGAAGAGKTYVLNSYINHLRSHRVGVAVTASTGIAATHLSGQTIHSWCGMGTRESLTKDDLHTIASNKRLAALIRRAKVLIIDEISMLHAKQLQMVDQITREIRGGGESFGGLQVVLCGDFFQLPPVTKNDEVEKFAFSSQAWREGRFTVCYLHEQHRQQADPLLGVLNDIRSGKAGEQTKVPLRLRYRRIPTDAQGRAFEPTLLYARNINVDAINEAALAQLLGERRTFHMTSRGFKAHVEALQRSCLAPSDLCLKVGAQVMFVKNNAEGLYVNGTRGTVESFDPVDGWPEVRTLDGAIICAEPVEWRLEEGGISRASITQVPLRLAWAITIHKSQGMTLDAAEVDLSDAFEPGMGYVALSRVRTLSGLKLMGLNAMALQVHPDVLEQDHALRRASDEAVSRLHSQSNASIESAVQETLLRRFAGALPDANEEPPTSPSSRKAKPKGGRIQSHLITRDLVSIGTPLEVIAQERGISLATVVSHLEKLKGEGQLPDIDYVRKAIPESDFKQLVSEFESSEDGKLKPIVDKFNGAFSFDTVKLVRLFVN